MKTSVNWLKNYVEIPWQPEVLAEKLTLAGLEVEEIVSYGTVPEGVIIAEIKERRAHPNADKLSICTVAASAGEMLQVVCGAPNCDAGVKVPLAIAGTDLGQGFKIKKAKLRGETSEGMLCSIAELGLGTDRSGLWILPQDAPLGQSLNAYLCADTVIDWEVTPNRADWLCHIGIAREIAAVADMLDSFRLPDTTYKETGGNAADAAAVEVLDTELCPRYVARVIQNVKIGPSPEWMQNALRSVGIRPVNNIVDITNYVMMECGQPLHAFDYEQLAGHKIIVRRAVAGETIQTLDDKEHRLTVDNLVIADAERGVALAGVMGGANSEISANTSTVLLESAAFNAANIRATAKQHAIGTESSYRFERGVDIEMTEFASRRATALICELAGGEALKGSIDAYATAYQPQRVSCRFARVNQILGVEVASAAVLDYFARLGLEVSGHDAAHATILAPSFRPDLQREADLIEEVARLYGLEQIPARPAKVQIGGSMRDDKYIHLQEARAQLNSLGLHETLTYSLISSAAAVHCTGVKEDELVAVANPLSQEANCMRPSIIPSIMHSVARNIAYGNDNLALFELGRVVINAPNLAEERHQVGIVLTGRRHPERFGAEREIMYDFYDLKGLLESWFEMQRVPDWECSAAEHPAFQKNTCAIIGAAGNRVATIGEVAAELTADIRLKHPLLMAVVELEILQALLKNPRIYQPLPQFPAVVRDISLAAPINIENKQIITAVEAMECEWLEKIELFDIYQDELAEKEGRRSLAYSLTYRDCSGTLTDEQVNAVHEKVRQKLAAQLPVELR